MATRNNSRNNKLIITNTTRARVVSIAFEKILTAVLGKKYELSLVFVSETKIKNLNKQYRGKDTPTDILSFEISKDSGEIFICMKKTTQKAKEFGKNLHDYLGFLFIHGLLHLKGMSHGSTMEKAEKKFCQLFHF